MLTFASKYGANVFSQNGENGIIDECIKRIKPKMKTAVEFGAPTREYCSNINHLTSWDLRFFDINPNDPYITKAEITPANVNEIIPPCSLLSIDIDGDDYNVWEAYKGTPDIVVIEINSSYAPDVYHVSSREGASYAMMNKLGESKDYFLLCHTGNMIFVRNQHKHLFPEVTLDPITNAKQYFNTSWLH